MSYLIDVGCGLGEWGKGIQEWEVETYIGIDYKVPRKRLLIPEQDYIEADLSKVFPTMNRADLCLCLEVAEHLPEERAPALVEYLCSLSDYVLFSAAIPGQGGVGHINEQWQTWWERLFNQNGYYASEKPIRDLIQHNENIAVWYRQNMVLYSKHFRGKVQDFVHPQMWLNIVSTRKTA